MKRWSTRTLPRALLKRHILEANPHLVKI